MKSISSGIMSAIMVPLGVAALAAGGGLAAPTAALANTFEGPLCMQRVYAGPNADITNSNRLNCSANDIRLARAISARNAETGEPVDSCVRGQTIDLEATFEVVVTANARYDASFFFRTDGGSNARGDGAKAEGACLVSGLRRDVAPGLNLDGDGVGDLNAGSYEVTVRFDGLACEGDSQGKLKLPNCTSWHSNASTVADIDNVWSWKPETKSKCRCDDGFTLDVNVEDPRIKVVKTARTDYVSEHLGGTVTFDVTVTNENKIESLSIGGMVDRRWWPGSDPATANPSEVENLLSLSPSSGPDGTTPCAALDNATLAPGESLSCAFTDAVPGGQAGQQYVNTVVVTGYQVGTGAEVTGTDSAKVSLTNLKPQPALTKKAKAVTSCKVEVEYSVEVYNASLNDTILVQSLVDDKFGDITKTVEQGGSVLSTTCRNGVKTVAADWIAVADTYSCTFTALVEEETCWFDHVNEVTATGIDDDDLAFEDAAGTATIKVRQRLNPDKPDSNE